MAALPALELEEIRLKTEFEKRHRDHLKAELKHKGELRELNLAENNAIIAYVGKLLVGRRAWLKQMQEAKAAKLGRELTVQEENQLKNKVYKLLKKQPQFIANFKYESDKITDAVVKPQSGFEAMIQGMLSKLTGAFGDGPFAFIGKLITQIFSFILPMISAFKEMGEQLNPKKTAADLLKEGLLDDADAVLTTQENELVQKLKTVERETKSVREIADHAKITELLGAYTKQLDALKEVKVDTEVVPFSKATDNHKTEVLQARIAMFNMVSSKTAAALQADAEALVAEKRHTLTKEQGTKLEAQHAAAAASSPTQDILAQRLEAVRKDLQALETEKGASRTKENDFVAQFDGIKNSVEAYNFTELFRLETERQKALVAKAAADAAAAERQMQEQRAFQLKLAEAQAKKSS